MQMSISQNVNVDVKVKFPQVLLGSQDPILKGPKSACQQPDMAFSTIRFRNLAPCPKRQ